MQSENAFVAETTEPSAIAVTTMPIFTERTPKAKSAALLSRVEALITGESRGENEQKPRASSGLSGRTSSAANVGTDKDSDKRQMQSPSYAKRAGFQDGSRVSSLETKRDRQLLEAIVRVQL